MKLIFMLASFISIINAQLLISPKESMHLTFGEDVVIKKKNILLTKKQAAKIQTASKVRLNSNIFRVYSAIKDSKVIGYGILVNQKVRSKNAVILYHISINDILKSIEIISFNEPIEYLPSKNWNTQFNNKQTSKPLNISKDIPTISGATLSAKSIIDASRIAFAIYSELLKGKK